LRDKESNMPTSEHLIKESHAKTHAIIQLTLFIKEFSANAIVQVFL
jgi:hypothetical protein